MANGTLSDGVLVSHNPCTGEPLGSVPATPPDAVHGLVRSAAQAAQSWAATGLPQRAKVLAAVLDDYRQEPERFVSALVDETGQCPSQVRFAHLLETVPDFRWHLKNLPRLLSPRPVPISAIDFPGKKVVVERSPLGVVALITPWNYPWTIPLRTLIPALLAGNAVVFKPSEHTPLVGQALADLFQAHLPKDVLQILHGDGATGKALVESPVDGVFFTGSVAVGRSIGRTCGERFVPAHLELGGKDAAVVLADADLDRSALGVVWGAMNNSGQDCSSIERAYIERSVFEPFCKRVTAIMAKLQPYSPGATTWDIGPLITQEQAALVRSQLADAREHGAKLVAGSWPEGEDALVPPIALNNLPPSCRLINDETFGPVLPLIPVDSAEAALELANASHYQLGMSVWTSDLARGGALCRASRAGVTSVNGSSWVGVVTGAVWGGPGDTGGGATGGEEMAFAVTRATTRTWDKSKPPGPNWYPLDAAAETLSKGRLAMDGKGSGPGNLLAVLGSLGKRTKALWAAVRG